MPTYEYECKECGTVFDVFQSIKARPLRKAECPECHTSRPVKRLISTGGAVIFKGSGFYETDYRSESYKKAAKAEKDSGTASSASGTEKAASSESKPSDTKSNDTASTKPKTSDKPAAKKGGAARTKAKASA